MRAASALVVAALFLYGVYGAAASDYAERTDVGSFVDSMVADYGFSRSDLLALFGKVERKQGVLDAIARPAEKVKPWHEYRDLFVTQQRIQGGIEFWRANDAALSQATAQFGVPADVVVAILGVETLYGKNTGTYRVVDALTTLAFDYPPRAPFFRNELAQFLLLAREEGVDALSLTGSYAGAMGYGQFIPSSFRTYSIDFDGDGKRDIWRDPVDAIGSVANYFNRQGWRANGPVVVRAEVVDGRADTIANDALALDHTVGTIRALGVTMPAYADDEPALLLKLDGDAGPEYWVGLHNFFVITRYNRSAMYALAVHQLGASIASAVGGAPVGAS